MSTEAENLYQAALKLPEDERYYLASRLLESVEGERDPDYEEAWSAEIARRIEEIDNGTAKMIPWEEVQAKLREKLNGAADVSNS